MNRQKSAFLAIVLLAWSLHLAESAIPTSTAFTYQGRLNNGATAVTGLYDLTFSIWNASSGPAQVGNTLTNIAVPVTNGLFTVALDFGASIFDGNARWLELSARTNGAAALVTLTPRQALAATPYAQYAPSAGNATQADAVAAGAITTSMIADGAVTTTKIGPAAVKPSNLDDGGNPAYQAVLANAEAFDGTSHPPLAALSLVSSNSGAAPSLTLTLDAAAFGTVIGFVGHEAMSEPYTYVVEVLERPGQLDPNLQMGRRARLSFARNGQTTTFAGLITGCSVSSYDGKDDLYTFRIEPPLAWLALTTDYRVYQEQSTPTIVAGLYRDLTSFDLSATLSGTYPKLENAIQHGETALNFAGRLLETEGIFYFFSLGGSPPALILGDSRTAYLPANVTVYRYYGDTVTNLPANLEVIRSFQNSARESTRTSKLNAYDFKKPSLDLLQMAENLDGFGQGIDYLFGSAVTVPATLKARVKVRQERQDVERATRFGTANGPDLRAGYTFTLDDRTGSGLEGLYVVTAVRHAAFRRMTNGVASLYYGNQFEVIPVNIPFRPPFKSVRPVALPSLAKVTGPAGQEIYTDEYGRVKVQFTWDQYGANNETSSAWVRVASPWAGASRGVLFLPRIGDEVLVGFVQGDPDLPVVTGSLRNSVNVPPYPLPASQTRSTIRTESSPGGGGANEIRFEDKKGSEELMIAAEKDLLITAKNDLNLNVGNDLKLNAAVNFQATMASLTLTASQGIGIGTGPDPSLALKVNGTANATAFQGDGSALANLSAPALTGTVNDARLSANVARLNASQSFSGANTFLGPIGIGGGVSAESLNINGNARLNDYDLFLRGNNGDTAHGLGWYGTDKPFGTSSVDGPVLYGCGGGALGTLCGAPLTALVWNNAGNVGIGVDIPGTRLDVAGTVRATSFSGDGAGLMNLNAANLSAGVIPAARLPANVALLTSSAAFVGSVSASGATVNGDARVTGLLRSGSESGTSQGPTPAGLVVRRINSTSVSSNLVVARTDQLTLERDGTKAGLLIRYPASAGFQTINAVAMNNVGNLLAVHTVLTNGPAGIKQLFADAQRVVHAQISFGNTYAPSHVTQVVLDRYDDGSPSANSGNDYYWIGTIASTYNQ